MLIDYPEKAYDAIQMLIASLKPKGVNAVILYKLEKARQLCEQAIRDEVCTPAEALELLVEVQNELDEDRTLLN